ncbi:metallophosphoesterase [Actinomycetaceae bacterium L2_0104]
MASFRRNLVSNTLRTGLALGTLAGAWGLVEAQAFTLRRRSILLDGGENVPSPAAGRTLRVLQLTDIHLLPRQRNKIRWIQKLAQTEPDLVLLTGDQLSSPKAVAPLLKALAPFAGIPGAFVYGSNDYYGPFPKNPFIYLLRDHSKPHTPHNDLVELPWREMTAAFESNGWINLGNARGQLRIGEWNVDLVGVDDPHIGLDEFPLPDKSVAPVATAMGATQRPAHAGAAGGAGVGASANATNATNATNANIKIGLTHAPYKRVLDRMVEDECTAIFAGHTHGGQVCVPGVGALVTNCDLEREYASGLFQWPPTGKGVLHGDGIVPTGIEHRPTSWVNVATGIGTSPFTPVRVVCRPEAVLVEFVVV